jgi:hypothetical protein
LAAAAFRSDQLFSEGPDELMHLRAETAAGRGEVAIDDGKFSLADYRGFLTDNDDGIAAFRQQKAVAFAAERRAWDLAGEFRRASEGLFTFVWHSVHRSLTITGVNEGTLLALWRNRVTRRIPGTWRSSASSRYSNRP